LILVLSYSRRNDVGYFLDGNVLQSYSPAPVAHFHRRKEGRAYVDWTIAINGHVCWEISRISIFQHLFSTDPTHEYESMPLFLAFSFLLISRLKAL
jgi:hypothetical protein